MNDNAYFFILFCMILSSCQPPNASEDLAHYFTNPASVHLQYPSTQKGTVVDTFFGQPVADPYRWLEAAVSDEPQKPINQWVNAQRQLARNYLDSIAFKKDIYKRMKALYNYERISAPFTEGDYQYYSKNDGLQNQAVIYQVDKSGQEVVFLDPNSFSDDGTVSLSGLFFSKDGRYAAYRTSESGSDWGTVQVIETENRQLLNDKVEWLRYSGVSWFQNGFFYSRYGDNSQGDKFTQKNEFHQVYYHQLGSNQQDDALIFADKSQPNRNFGLSVTEDERIWVLSVTESTSGNALYCKKSSEQDFRAIVQDFDHDFNVIDNVGDTLLVMTNYKAAKYQVFAIDIHRPEPKYWDLLIPEQKEATLNSVQMIGGYLMARYTQQITTVVQVYDLKGNNLGPVKLPPEFSPTLPLTISSLQGKKSLKEAYFTLSSFTIPATVCKLNTQDRSSEVWRRPVVPFNSEDFEIEFTQYTSKDGSSIPISIVYKKGLKKTGDHPLLLYGYGGFNIPILPSFALKRLPFLEKGGIYAVANIRGGGEMGQAWHKAGTQLNKQNVFDDFIAAAEFLIEENYTNSDKIAIEGRSNGGLLVGACMTQRPDLFRVALPIVGVLDMLRYHQFTIGHFWASDYGRSDDSIQFPNLLSYSPVHNCEPHAYPATMVMTADHDDRVVPAHSFKFGAALQEHHQGQRPIIIRIDSKAGHGAGKPTEKIIEEEVDKLAFLMFNLGMSW